MNPVLALIITNTIWGAAPPIFKFALQNIPPFTLAFIRFFFASLLVLPYVLKHWQKINGKDFLIIIAMAVLGVSINISFFFMGLAKTESINASIIASSAPVFLFFLSMIFLKERPKFKVFSGMLLSFLGVLAVILSPIFLDGKKFALGEIQGNLFFLIAVMSLMVLDPLVSKGILKRINPFQIVFLTFILGSIPFLPLAMRELNHWSFSQLNLNGWVGIIYGIFFSSALAYFFYYFGISKLKAQEVGIFNYIDPVTSVLIAAPLLGEYPSAYFLIGAVLVFTGIFIAEGRLHWHPFHRLRR